MARKIRREVCKFELLEYYDSYIWDEDRNGYICDDCATVDEWIEEAERTDIQRRD